jgi:hypothetical protein
MFREFSDDDTYTTCKHEALHCLRALASGHEVLSVNIDTAQSLLQWSLFPWEVRTLVRTDTEYVTALVKGVIGTCLAPALQERQPANPVDAEAYEIFLRSWPRSAPITRDILYRQAVAETKVWLGTRETQRQVRQMAERFFVHRASLIDGELLAQIVARVTAPPPAPLVAGPGRPTPRPTTTAAQRDLENLIAYYELPSTATAPAPKRNTPYAQDYRPNGRHRQHLLVA